VGFHKIRPYLAPMLLCAGFAAALAANWPGQMSYDSVVQLADGRSGHYDSWHPVVMAWLLGLFDAILPGPGLFMAFTVLLLWGAWLTILRIGRPGPATALLLLAVLLTPQLVLYQGEIWKDVLFANAGIAGFAALAAAVALWERPQARWAWLAASAAVLSLATLSRQNGFLLLPIAAIALGIVAARKSSHGHGWRYGFGLLAASLAFTVLANYALSFRSDGGQGASDQLHLALTYDLVGAARRDPAIHFPALEREAPRLDAAIRQGGVPAYSPHLVDTLEDAPGLIDQISHAPRGAIFAAWRGLVFGHPGIYLAERWPVFRWVFVPPDILVCHPDVVGVDGPKEELDALGLKPQIRSQDRFLYLYVARFFQTPILSHLLYAALAALFLVLLIRRSESTDIVIAGLLAAALVFTVSFFVISIACDYRYLYFLDLAAMTGALQFASGGVTSSKKVF
jgi:4-amino-4-deoxy-L-arabinose transferase-like glycosyltransferase